MLGTAIAFALEVLAHVASAALRGLVVVGGVGAVAAWLSSGYRRLVAQAVYGTPARDADDRVVALLLDAEVDGAELAVAAARDASPWWVAPRSSKAPSSRGGGGAAVRSVLVVMGGSGAVAGPLLDAVAELNGRKPSSWSRRPGAASPPSESAAESASASTAETAPVVRIHVADASPAALDLLRERHRDRVARGELVLHHVPDLVSDAGTLSTAFEDGAFDVVVAHKLLRRVPRERRRDALSELRRVSRGVLCVTFQETHRLDSISQKAVLMNLFHLVSTYSTRDVMAELGMDVAVRQRDGVVALVGRLR